MFFKFSDDNEPQLNFTQKKSIGNSGTHTWIDCCIRDMISQSHKWYLYIPLRKYNHPFEHIPTSVARIYYGYNSLRHLSTIFHEWVSMISTMRGNMQSAFFHILVLYPYGIQTWSAVGLLSQFPPFCYFAFSELSKFLVNITFVFCRCPSSWANTCQM